MPMNLGVAFEKFSDDFLKYQEVANPSSRRADLHAFILLDQICPGQQDIVSASEHDEYFLSIDCLELALVVTEDQVRDLVRCGVRYSSEYECLCMYA